MPDFFDRLIARGAQPPGGGMPSSGRAAHQAGGTSDPSAVTLALPRLPGPFERLATEPPDPFTGAIDESREADAAPAPTARAWPALGRLAGTQAAITPPPFLRAGTTPQAPGFGPPRPGEQSPARPVPADEAPLRPRVTPAGLVAEARTAALDLRSARAGRPTADPDQERGTPAGRASRQERSIVSPSPPRMLAVPASAVHATRPAATGDDARAGRAQPPAPPPVVVRIGRIEVRNATPERRERPARRRPGRAGPKLTLAEYLAAASGGRNGNWAGGGR
jgi:hypothetical protein